MKRVFRPTGPGFDGWEGFDGGIVTAAYITRFIEIAD